MPRAPERLKKIALMLAGVSAIALPGAAGAARAHVSAATATHHYILVHVNANHAYPYNCGNADWYATWAFCWGRSAPSGDSYGFSQTIVPVSWCAPSSTCYMGHDRTMPHGYVRWMKFCEHYGSSDCKDWLIGAVQMPNGPFHVVAGMIQGHHVYPDSGDQTKIAHVGGPLHLVVTFTGYISNGGGVPASHGYTFGVIGYVTF